MHRALEQMELKMRHITKTNMEDMNFRLYYTQHAYSIAQQQQLYK